VSLSKFREKVSCESVLLATWYRPLSFPLTHSVYSARPIFVSNSQEAFSAHVVRWTLARTSFQNLSSQRALVKRAIVHLALRDPGGGGGALSLFRLPARSPRQQQATTHSLPSTESRPAQKRLQTSAGSQRSAELWPSVARERVALSDTFAWTNICVSEYMSRKKGHGQRGQQPPARLSFAILFESCPISGTA
jgi:hypothetical protein